MAKFETVEAYVESLDAPLRDIAEHARKTIDAALIGVDAAMWHGHPVWSLGEAPGQQPVALIKAYGSYVTFALWRGQSVTDPSGRLEAASRQMAQVKLRSVADIDADLFTGWLHQARDLEA
ncbi:DUF1801 domain-containing protein [Streptomyces sp. NPDC008141]|uniref:DUF1801 domain-containing protein n=1 Tax=Streptomyces sp. NPDC008141 TaxID=3364815 RepID=UPI0036F0D3D9